MDIQLYSFTYNHYVLIPVIAVIIQSYLLFRIYLLGFSQTTHRWFAAYLLIIIAAGIASLFTSASSNPVDATFWSILFVAVNAYSLPTLLIFTLIFTNHEYIINTLWKQLLFYVPSYLIMLLTLFTDTIYSHSPFKTRLIHMLWQPQEGPWYNILYTYWLNLIVGICIIFFLLHAKQAVDKRRRLQSYIFALALIFQMFFYILLIHLVREVLGFPIIPEGTFMNAIMATIIAWGILKFDLFTINPTIVASRIINTVTESIFVINPAGIIEFINPAMQKTVGYQEAEVIGKNIRMMIGTEENRFNALVLKPLLDGKQKVNMSGSINKKDNTKFPVSLSASTITDSMKRVVAIVCVATDISKLQELYDVTSQRNKLNTIMESISDGIFSLDEKGDIIQINRAGLKLIDLQESDVIGKPVEHIAQIIDDTQTEMTSQSFMKALAHPESADTRRNKYKLITTKGEERFVRIFVSGLQDKADAPMQAIVTMHDKTDEYQLDQMKVDFVSMAAHELRTPLATIRGYLSVFISENKNQLNEQQNMFLNRMQISSQRLVALVENLLSVTRIEKKTLVLKPVKTDWPALVSNLTQELESRAKEKKITLMFEKPQDKIPEVEVDTVRIGEVVTNLIANAINYTPEGGLVTISIKEHDNELITQVRDTGEGIPQAAMTHLFTKFYRVSGNAIAQVTKGTGLGLYISKSIVEMHHSKIWVESQVQKGSTFSFSIPFIQPIVQTSQNN